MLRTVLKSEKRKKNMHYMTWLPTFCDYFVSVEVESQMKQIRVRERETDRVGLRCEDKKFREED